MKEIKISLHIPTEQYGFIAVECEGLTADETAALYKEYSTGFQPKAGISEKDYNTFIDRMLLGQEGNHIEQYVAMSDQQKYAVQVIKRGLKRIKPEA